MNPFMQHCASGLQGKVSKLQVTPEFQFEKKNGSLSESLKLTFSTMQKFCAPRNSIL